MTVTSANKSYISQTCVGGHLWDWPYKTGDLLKEVTC